jgi:hypothetical protein
VLRHSLVRLSASAAASAGARQHVERLRLFYERALLDAAVPLDAPARALARGGLGEGFSGGGASAAAV